MLSISTTSRLLLQEYRQLFKKIGFTILNINTEKPVVTHIPHIFQDRDIQETLLLFLEQLENGVPLPKVDKISEEMIAFLACRAAVKAGDQLDKEQMIKIIEDLEKTPHNATCPHGRPTRTFISLYEIDTFFKR